MAIKEKEKHYWHGPIGTLDDFGDAYSDIMIDGKTKYGPWACMTNNSWRRFGVGKLGTGLGQMYEKQADGRWLKIEG